MQKTANGHRAAWWGQRWLSQTLLVMRLTIILLTAGLFQVHANGISQTVTLTGKNMPVKEVFSAIKAQTGYSIFGNLSLLEKSRLVSVDVVNMDLLEFLKLIVKDQPFSYRVADETIILSEKKASNLSPRLEMEALPPPITGIVRGPDGQPLAGVNVVVKGSKRGVSTNAYGNFSIEAKAGDVLVISSIGYGAKEIKVNGENNILVGLELSTSPLDEVQIIAYGETSKRFQTGNVSSVKAEDIAKQPVANPLLALQGRVPGLFIEQATGLPGSGVKVRIQGQNSLTQGSDPLYVIDGVPFISQMPLGLSGIQGQSGDASAGNPLSYLNPADIESIEVLKDADATSIYGSRAAAGAILITTKKGKAGKAKIDLNVQQGWSKVGKFVDLLNTQQYLEMRNEALKNDGIPAPRATDYDLNGTWDSTRYTDWQKELIGGTAKYTDAQLSLSGGTATTTFFVGGGYHRETTVYPGKQPNQNASLHLSTSHRSLDQRFNVGADVKYMVSDIRLMSRDLTQDAVRLVPVAPALYNADGSLNWAPNASGVSAWRNPLAYLEETYENQVNNLISNLVISYKLFEGLEIKSSAGYTNFTQNGSLLRPLTAIAPELRPISTRSSNFSNDRITSWIIEPQASFKRPLGGGNLEALLGGTFSKNQTNGQGIFASGFSSDLLMKNPSAAPNFSSGGTIDKTYKYNALFGRLNYNLYNRYILNLNARRDGSSRFGSENLFQNFWSVAGAWIFSEENAFKKALPFLSFGKLRGSYGTSGNEQIGDYGFMSLYFANSRPAPYQGITGLATYEYPNPFLQWEETRKLQGGFELGIFKNRILLNAGYYRNRSSNQLQSYAVPVITGVNTITANFPATIQNWGWELALNSINVQNRNFSWNSSLNLTISRNKLIAYKDLEKSTYASQYVVGEPFTIVRLFPFAGVDPATGLYRFYDSKGNITSDVVFPDDAIILLNPVPKLFGGLQNNISCKGLSLDFLVQFVVQKAQSHKYGDLPGRFSSRPTGSVGNQPTSVMDRWRQPGDNSRIQRFSATYPFEVGMAFGNARSSDDAYTDASYARLKNVSLSWQLPEQVLQQIRLQNLRIYTQAQNLLTITGYKAADPETNNPSGLPPLRVWTFGLQITL